MTYDSNTDPLVAVMRAIAKEEVSTALSSFGAAYPAVRDTLGFPIPLDMIEVARLPLMTIHVAREGYVETTRKFTDHTLTVQVEYFMPPTALQLLDARWPTLRLVWRTLMEKIYAGALGAVTTAMSDVGAIEFDRTSPTVTYDHAFNGEQAYPHFLGTFVLVWRPVDATIYPDLMMLAANINRVDGNEEIQPQVQLVSSGPHLAYAGTLTLGEPTTAAEVMALANELRAAFEFHRLSVDAHLAVDTTSAVGAPAATDDPSTYALLDALVLSLSTHLGDGTTDTWHRGGEPESIVPLLIEQGFATLPPPAATDLDSSIYTASLLRFAFGHHFALGFDDE